MNRIQSGTHRNNALFLTIIKNGSLEDAICNLHFNVQPLSQTVATNPINKIKHMFMWFAKHLVIAGNVR